MRRRYDYDLSQHPAQIESGEAATFSVYLYGCRPWEAWEDGEPAAVMAKSQAMIDRGEEDVSWGTCPTCRRAKMGRSHYCLRCDRSGQDHKRLRGLPVGRYMDPDYPAEPTVYSPDGKLRGGTE
jgi:hypothetical protein